MAIETYDDNTTVKDAIQTKVVNDLTELFAATAAITAGSGVLVSSDDTNVGYLNGKLLAGEGIDFTEGNGGADETLTIKGEDAGAANKGIVELATNGETVTGTDTTRATTPANVAAKLADYTKDEDDMASDSAAHVATQQSIKAYVDASAILPTNYITGLVLSNDAGDTAHDVNVTAGECRDSTDADDITLASEITKQIDAAWAVGDDAGGMDTGSVPAAATIHVWLIKRSDTGVVDALFSISATAPTMPENYDYKRRIGSYRTTGSNIINGDWWGTGVNRTFMYDTPILDINATNPGASAVTAALSVPAGIRVKCFYNGRAVGLTAMSVGVYVSSLDNADLAPSTTAAPLISVDRPTYGGAGSLSVHSNTSSQIRYRLDASGASDTFKLTTLGWEDSL